MSCSKLEDQRSNRATLHILFCSNAAELELSGMTRPFPLYYVSQHVSTRDYCIFSISWLLRTTVVLRSAGTYGRA